MTSTAVASTVGEKSSTGSNPLLRSGNASESFSVQVSLGSIADSGDAVVSVTARKSTSADEIVRSVVERSGGVVRDAPSDFELTEVFSSGGQICKERRLLRHENPVKIQLLWPRLSASAASYDDAHAPGYSFALRRREPQQKAGVWVDATNRASLHPESFLGRFLQQPRNREYPDLCNLPDLNEQTLLENLKRRFDSGMIYTYVGSILISINPFRFFPIYNPKYVRLYQNRRLSDLPPHIFAIADAAFCAMMTAHRNQCIVISGESGSGKTESTNLLLSHLSALSQRGFYSDGIEQSILGVGPVLEAFGNAKTVHNNNSSRFGKFIQVNYRENGSVHGASVEKYLLEKSRIVSQVSNERNYHVFYYLLAGASAAEIESFHLKSPRDYFYLNQNDCYRLEGLESDSESQEFARLKHAMDIVGFSQDNQRKMFTVLSAVLHLGNIEFKKKSEHGYHDEAVTIKNMKEISIISDLLKVKEMTLIEALTKRKTMAGGEIVVISCKMAEAIATRDATAKCLYSALFDWIVFQVNANLISKHDRREHQGNSIGVLDIFGFEDFTPNSFEQFCINYANESLHYYFNQHIFKFEQEEYMREGIQWKNIEFIDNTDCLYLFSKKPTGLLCLLDEECNFPGATNETLLNKFNTQHQNNIYFEVPPTRQSAFIIIHYAGKVKYHIQDFREKNSDLMRHDIVVLLKNSNLAFLRELVGQDPLAVLRWALVRVFFRACFAFIDAGKRHRKSGSNVVRYGGAVRPPPTQKRTQLLSDSRKNKAYRPRFRAVRQLRELETLRFQSSSSKIPLGMRTSKNKSKPPSISAQFHSSLQRLMETLNQANPFFIRCIKSNAQKTPCYFDDDLVQRQLRYTGMLATVKIRQSGYNYRLKFEDFILQYHLLLPKVRESSRDAIESYLHSLDLNQENYQIGKTKVFLRETEKLLLEDVLHQAILERVRLIQRWTRKRLDRRRFMRMRSAAIKIQTSVRCLIAKRQLSHLRRRHSATVLIQKIFRGFRVRKWMKRRKEAALTIQKIIRGFLTRKRLTTERKADTQRSPKAAVETPKGGFNVEISESSWEETKSDEDSKASGTVDSAAGTSEDVGNEIKGDGDKADVKTKRDDVRDRVRNYVTGGSDGDVSFVVRQKSSNDAPDGICASTLRPTDDGNAEEWFSADDEAFTPDVAKVVPDILTPDDAKVFPSDVYDVRKISDDTKDVTKVVPDEVGTTKVVPDKVAAEIVPDVLKVDPDKVATEVATDVTNVVPDKVTEEIVPDVLKVVPDKVAAEIVPDFSKVDPNVTKVVPDVDVMSSIYENEVDVKLSSSSATEIVFSPDDDSPSCFSPVTPGDSDSHSAPASPANYLEKIVGTTTVKPSSGGLRVEGGEDVMSALFRIKRDVSPSPRRTMEKSQSAILPLSMRTQPGPKDLEIEVKPAIVKASSEEILSPPFLATVGSVQEKQRIRAPLARMESFTDRPVAEKGRVDTVRVLIEDNRRMGQHLGDGKEETGPAAAEEGNSGILRNSPFKSTKKTNKTKDSFGVTPPIAGKVADNSNRKQKQKPKPKPGQNQPSSNASTPINAAASHGTPTTMTAGTWSVSGTAQWQYPLDKVVRNGQELKQLEMFFGTKILLVNKSSGRKESVYDIVFKDAVNEFHSNLITQVSTAVQENNIVLRYKELMCSFEELLNAMGRRMDAYEANSATVFINAFRGFLDEFIKKRDNKELPDVKMKKEPVKGKKKKENVFEYFGHQFFIIQFTIPTFCEMCATRVWVLDKGYVCKACKLTVHKKCYDKEKSHLSCIKRTNEGSGMTQNGGSIIGAPLSSLVKESCKVPSIIETLITTIEMNGLYTIGLYRKPGNAVKIKQLIKDINTDPSSIDFSDIQIHILTSVLKTFFRDMPEPLMTFELYDEFVRVTEIKDEKEKTKTLYNIVEKLPQSNYNLLERLIFHLAKVAQQESVNLMSANALAIIFSPSILRTQLKPLTQDSLKNVDKQTTCIQCIIESQLKKLRSTLADIRSLDTASVDANEKLATLRASKRHIMSVAIANFDNCGPTIPFPDDDHDDIKILSAAIQSIEDEKEALTIHLPALEYRTSVSEDDMLSTDELESTGDELEDRDDDDLDSFVTCEDNISVSQKTSISDNDNTFL